VIKQVVIKNRVSLILSSVIRIEYKKIAEENLIMPLIRYASDTADQMPAEQQLMVLPFRFNVNNMEQVKAINGSR